MFFLEAEKKEKTLFGALFFAIRHSRMGGLGTHRGLAHGGVNGLQLGL